MHKSRTNQPPAPCLTFEPHEILHFEFHGIAVRAVLIDGDPWFIAADLCGGDVLSYPDAGQATRYLDRDEKTTLLIKQDGSNYKSRCILVSESGLYTLIIRSRGPQAKPFRRWVTKEVLPAIRKTGRYAVANDYPPMTIDPIAMIRAALGACEEIGLGPRASQTIVREFGVRMGAPEKLLPVVPPYKQMVYQIEAPYLPTRQQLNEKTAISIRQRREKLKMQACDLAREAFPNKAPDVARGIVYRMERGQSLTERNLVAVDAVLGEEPPVVAGRTCELTVACSTLERFPHIPDLCKLGLHFDKHSTSEKQRLKPAHRLATDIFEAWV